MLIMLAIFDLGRGIYAYTTITAAAQAGARYALIHPEDTDAVQAVVADYLRGVDTSQVTTTVSQPDGDTVEVTITYLFQPATPLIGSLIGSNGVLTMQVSAAMHRY